MDLGKSVLRPLKSVAKAALYPAEAITGKKLSKGLNKLPEKLKIKICPPPLIYSKKKDKCIMDLDLDRIGLNGLGALDAKFKPVLALAIITVLLVWTWPK